MNVEWLTSITGILTAIVVEFISTGPATFPFSNIEESVLTGIVVESILIGGEASFPFMDGIVEQSVLTALSVESILIGRGDTFPFLNLDDNAEESGLPEVDTFPIFVSMEDNFHGSELS